MGNFDRNLLASVSRTGDSKKISTTGPIQGKNGEARDACLDNVMGG